MNITQQRAHLSKLTELALMMQIAESFKTVSPQYYNDRMAVLEPEYRQGVQNLVNSLGALVQWPVLPVDPYSEALLNEVPELADLTKDVPKHETLRIPATHHAASKIVPGFKDPYEAPCGGQ